MLFDLQTVGMRGCVLDKAEIEVHGFHRLVLAQLPLGYLDALFDERLAESEFIEEVESRWMKC